VRCQHAEGTGGDVGLRSDEANTASLEFGYHPLVVNDLAANVDGWSLRLEETLDDLKGSFHAGTEPPRRGKDYASTDHRHHVRRFASRIREVVFLPKGRDTCVQRRSRRRFSPRNTAR
jgi:hypothetical protein